MSAGITLGPPALAEVLDGVLDGVHGTGVVWAQVDGEPCVVKVATGPERAVLRREAEALLHLEHLRVPGVVTLRHLVDDERLTALVLADAGAHTLAAPGELSPARILRALHRTARSLHELHVMGWSHGGLRGEHVVISARGEPRLCSFGAARRGSKEALRRDDAALVELLGQVGAELESDGARREGRQVRRAVRVLRRSPEPTAIDVAVALERHTRSRFTLPRLTLPESGVRVGVAMAASIAFVAAGIGGWWRSAPAPDDARDSIDAVPTEAARAERASVRSGPLPETPTTETPTTETPTTETPGTEPTSRAPVVVIDGRAYRVGLPGDQVEVIDAPCTNPAVWLLRPSTGELFRFDGLPSADRPVEGELVDTLAPPATLRLGPAPAASKCPSLVTVDAAGVEQVRP